MNTESVEQYVGIGAIGLFTALFGWLGWLILLYAFCMVADVASGTALAIKDRQWDSSKARAGLWKKCGSMTTVGVAALVDILLGIIINVPGIKLPFEYTALLCPIVVVWYIIAELGSILENADGMGAPIPAALTNVLKKVKSIGDQ